jgi:DNA-binding transcriptional regulator LsrR (DeoR family)
VIQCLGGLSEPDPSVNGAELVRRMAQAFNAKPQLLYAPGLVNSPEVRDALLKDPQIAKTLQLAAQVSVAIVGVGALISSSITVRNNILLESDIEQLKKAGAVGDINLRFFNSLGEAVDSPLNKRIIGLELAQIKKIPTVIAVSGGEEKYPAIRAAILGKLINVLITDNQTLVRLLDEQS